MRTLKALFRELSHTAEHVARENLGLVEWQRTGAGLPQGGLRG
jgi:enoyl-CoA hydratase